MNKNNIAKRGVLILIGIAIFIIHIIFVHAISYDIEYGCEQDICIKGEPIQWTISLFNYGQKKIEITSIELIDSVNSTVIAYYNITYDPYRSENKGLITIDPNSKINRIINTRLPKPNIYNSLAYRFCYSNTVLDNNILIRQGIYTLRNCDNKNYSINVLECNTDNHCSYNELCKNSKCVPLECGDGECQYISSHKCMDYDCCDPDSCGKAEYCENHQCIQLNCTEFESSYNHTCQKLNCSYDEQFSNHTCQKLNCSYDEQFSNHTCQKLNCAFFQSRVNRRCVNDKPLIFKLAVELVIISLIILLLVLDVRKYESKKKALNPKKEISSKNDEKPKKT